MDLLQDFNKAIQQYHFLPKNHLLLAVSGGVDSVVLCELCRQASLNFTIAHCNFRLRGEESERDEKFVRNLAGKYNVNIQVKQFDTEQYAVQNKISIQVAARNLRYEWFAHLQKTEGFSAVLLAHHADDNIETLLMNFFRGTGLNGLTGIAQWNEGSCVLRPMLHMRRKEIEIFAKENNLQWVEDSSNITNKYTRNLFRHDLIPAIKKIYPQVEENLLDTIERFKKIHSLYRLAVEKKVEDIVEKRGTEHRIPILKFLKYKNTSLPYEVIKEYGFGEKQVEEVIKLTEAASGKYIENDTYQIIKHRNWLIITTKTPSADTVAIEKDQKEILFSGGVLKLNFVSKEKFTLDKTNTTGQFDAKNIEFPLVLRKWKEGDYFYPLGMSKKKKLARFFIDQKLSKNQKENTWVIESNKKIIWIVGLRIDDRFKIGLSTKEIMQITVANL